MDYYHYYMKSNGDANKENVHCIQVENSTAYWFTWDIFNEGGKSEMFLLDKGIIDDNGNYRGNEVEFEDLSEWLYNKGIYIYI